MQLVGALAAAPYLLTSCLLTVWLAVLLARRVISHAPCPAPPLWAVPVLLLATAALATRLAVLQREAVALQSQLETQRWRAEQGARHRLDLLARLAGAGAGQRTEQQQTESLHNPLDGCLHVFIDLGSNRGLQIRFVLCKTYELFSRHVTESCTSRRRSRWLRCRSSTPATSAGRSSASWPRYAASASSRTPGTANTCASWPPATQHAVSGFLCTRCWLYQDLSYSVSPARPGWATVTPPPPSLPSTLCSVTKSDTTLRRVSSTKTRRWKSSLSHISMTRRWRLNRWRSSDSPGERL